MKIHIKTALVVILVFGMLMTSVSASQRKRSRGQKNVAVISSSQKPAEDRRTRELLIKVDRGEVDGLTIKVWKLQGGEFVVVDPASVFKKGDSIKVSFQSNFDGYVYIVNVTAGGKKKLLFPYEKEEGSESNNTVNRGREYQLPRNATWDFDEEVGVEVLQVYFSRDRVKVFDDAIKTAGGVLGTTAASAASELSARGTEGAPKPDLKGGISAETVAPVLTGNEAEGIRTRKIRLAPGKSQEQVAIPEDNGKPIKMQSGDVAVFEVRLKHI